MAAPAMERTICMDALPDDVLQEVLSRVGNVKDLFMLAVTCRRWLRHFTNEAFLGRVVCPGQGVAGHRARLLGFFFRHNRLLAFLPAPGSPLGPKTMVADDDFNYAEALAARHGIVLMRLVPCSFLETPLSLGICNPITGERHLLPPLIWSVPTVCLDQHDFCLVGERCAVVHRGAAHWLWINLANDLLYKLSTEVGTLCVSLTKLPIRVGGSPVLCVSRDGELSVACVYLEHVTVWTQQTGAAAWLRTAVIRIATAVPNPKYPPAVQPREMWYDFGRGSMLVVYRSSTVFVLDLEKKVMEKIMEDCLLPRFLQHRNETRSVPYEMDLVEFFLLQLGGLSMSVENAC
ncbi:unnamed protein product [Alopecurus aequalis]